ncbi:MAG TPA: hypothetical protein VM286_05250 [Candidatus Thermoplasmatota archaeon]|nr:hypothetical protein [Candidatus Thermoplasmatota archaeon]
MIRCEMRIDCGTPEEARVMAAALRVDDPAMAPIDAHGSHLVVRLSALGAGGLLRSADDVLECLRAARPGGSGPKESR